MPRSDPMGAEARGAACAAPARDPPAAQAVARAASNQPRPRAAFTDTPHRRIAVHRSLARMAGAAREQEREQKTRYASTSCAIPPAGRLHDFRGPPNRALFVLLCAPRWAALQARTSRCCSSLRCASRARGACWSNSADRAGRRSVADARMRGGARGPHAARASRAGASSRAARPRGCRVREGPVPDRRAPANHWRPETAPRHSSL